MKLSFKLVSSVLAAVMVGQSVVALAVEAPQALVTSAERAQDQSQEKKLKVLALALKEMDDQYQQIQSFAVDIGNAKKVGAEYQAEVDVESYWMKRSLGWFGTGTTAYLMLRQLPELKGFEAARYLNVIIRYAKSFTKPAAVFIVLGAGVTATATVMYVNGKTKINVSEAEMLRINTQIDEAKHHYNEKVAVIVKLAGELNSKITQNDRNIKIEGLNFPQLRNYTAGSNGVLQLQTFAEGNN